MATKKLASALVGAGLTAAALLGAGSANAASGPYVWNNSGSYVVMQCDDSCSSLQYGLRNGSTFYMYCWYDGATVTGNYRTNRWFKGTISGLSGHWYVTASYVYNQVSTPHC